MEDGDVREIATPQLTVLVPERRKDGTFHFATMTRLALSLQSIQKNTPLPVEITDREFLRDYINFATSEPQDRLLGELLGSLPGETIIALPDESLNRIVDSCSRRPQEIARMLNTMVIRDEANMKDGSLMESGSTRTALHSTGLLTEMKRILKKWKEKDPVTYKRYKKMLEGPFENGSRPKPYKGIWM